MRKSTFISEIFRFIASTGVTAVHSIHFDTYVFNQVHVVHEWYNGGSCYIDYFKHILQLQLNDIDISKPIDVTMPFMTINCHSDIYYVTPSGLHGIRYGFGVPAQNAMIDSIVYQFLHSDVGITFKSASVWLQLFNIDRPTVTFDYYQHDLDEFLAQVSVHSNLPEPVYPISNCWVCGVLELRTVYLKSKRALLTNVLSVMVGDPTESFNFEIEENK